MQPALGKEVAPIPGKDRDTESAEALQQELVRQQVREILEQDGHQSAAPRWATIRAVLRGLLLHVQAWFGISRRCSQCRGWLEMVGRSEVVDSTRFVQGTCLWRCPQCALAETTRYYYSMPDYDLWHDI